MNIDYNDMRYITVEDAKKEGLIPKEFNNEFPNNCNCGEPLYIKRNRKDITCMNRYCIEKLASKASEIFKRLGVEGMRKTFLKQTIRQNNITNVIDILKLPASKINNRYSIEVLSKYKSNMDIALSKPRLFSEVISCLAIPGLDKQALEIFKGINNCQELGERLYGYNTFEDWFCSRSLSYSLETIEQAQNFLDNLDELIDLSSLCNLIEYIEKIELNLVVTGKLNGMTKERFMNLINNNKKYKFKMGKAHASAFKVIADYPSTSDSYIRGMTNGNLITSSNFVKWLEKDTGCKIL